MSSRALEPFQAGNQAKNVLPALGQVGNLNVINVDLCCFYSLQLITFRTLILPSKLLTLTVLFAPETVGVYFVVFSLAIVSTYIHSQSPSMVTYFWYTNG